jgi:hypothetical protein
MHRTVQYMYNVLRLDDESVESEYVFLMVYLKCPRSLHFRVLHVVGLYRNDVHQDLLKGYR